MKHGNFPLIAVVTFFPVFATAGCSMQAPQEGQFRCTATSDCPEDWECNADGDGYCYSSEELFPPVETDSATSGDADTDSDSDTDTDSDGDSDSTTDTGTDSDTDTGTGEDTDTGTGEDTDTGTGEDTDTGTPLVLRVEAECAFGEVGDCDGTIQGGHAQIPSGSPYPPAFIPALSLNDLFVGYMSDGAWLRYDDLNLEGYTGLTMSVSGPATWGPFPIFEIRLDAVNGPIVATVAPGNTGGWDFFVERTDTFDSALEGVHDLFIVSTADEVGNIDWIEFTR